MAKRKSSRREQLKLAGTERIDRVPELDDLGEQYVDVSDQLEGLREEKHDLAEQIVEGLKAKKLVRYIFEDRTGKLYELSIADLDVKVSVRPVRKPREEAAPAPVASN